MIKLIDNISKRFWLWLIFFLSAILINIVFLFKIDDIIKEKSGFSIYDTSPLADKESLILRTPFLAQNAIKEIDLFYLWDTIFVLLFSVSMATALAFGLRQLRKEQYEVGKFNFLLCLPIIAMLIDFTENILGLYLVHNCPPVSANAINLMWVVRIFKLCSMVVVVGCLIIALEGVFKYFKCKEIK